MRTLTVWLLVGARPGSRALRRIGRRSWAVRPCLCGACDLRGLHPATTRATMGEATTELEHAIGEARRAPGAGADVHWPQ